MHPLFVYALKASVKIYTFLAENSIKQITSDSRSEEYIADVEKFNLCKENNKSLSLSVHWKSNSI